MLALPVVTGLAGFFPSLCLFALYWCYMTFTAFLILEVNLALGDNINLITMAKATLGRAGEMVAWVVYLFLLYLLTTSYLAGGGPILVEFSYRLTGLELPQWAGSLPFLFIFGFFVYEGVKYVDAVNRIMMLGLAIAYLAIAALLLPHINLSLLGYTDWTHSLAAVSIAVTSFGYHIIIPTLTTYMHHNVKELKKVILIGSLIPLLVYIIWEVMTLGVIPIKGNSGIMQGYQQGIDGVQLLTKNIQGSAVSLIAHFFSFFAIVTSFLGVTLSLSDFLADGLHLRKTSGGRLTLFVLTFIPPVLFIFSYPRAFLSALELAGAFGVVILLGLLPPLMAWSGRYRKGLPRPYTVKGGKPALILAILFSSLIIGVEIANKTGLKSCLQMGSG